MYAITTFYVFIMSCIFHTFILFVHMCTIYRIDLHINIVENKYQNGFLLFVSIITYEKNQYTYISNRPYMKY